MATETASPVSATAPVATRVRTLPRTAAISSIGISLPATVVGNAAVAGPIGVSEEWILKRTGIRTRHVLASEERLTHMATAAARDALERAGMDALELDTVLVATTTADEILPNAAPLVAHELGALRAGAFDIGAACTGFLAALAVGATQIEAGRADRVLVIGADAMSRITDPTCRQTAALFGDAAGAAVLTESHSVGRIGSVILGADGAGADLITVTREESLIRMQGPETFRHAVARMAQVTREAIEAEEWSLDDIDLFVYHQANARILRALGEHLDLTPDRVIDCIRDSANTSAATLPLALAHARDAGRLQPGSRVLLGAFGAGFTWGAAVVEWEIPEFREALGE